MGASCLLLRFPYQQTDSRFPYQQILDIISFHLLVNTLVYIFNMKTLKEKHHYNAIIIFK